MGISSALLDQMLTYLNERVDFHEVVSTKHFSDLLSIIFTIQHSPSLLGRACKIINFCTYEDLVPKLKKDGYMSERHLWILLSRRTMNCDLYDILSLLSVLFLNFSLEHDDLTAGNIPLKNQFVEMCMQELVDKISLSFDQLAQVSPPLGIYKISKLLAYCSTDEHSSSICAMLKRILQHLSVAQERSMMEMKESLLFSTLELVNTSQEAKETFLESSGIRIFSSDFTLTNNGISLEFMTLLMESVVSIMQDEELEDHASSVQAEFNDLFEKICSVVMSSTIGLPFAELVLDFISNFCLLSQGNVAVCKSIGGVALTRRLMSNFSDDRHISIQCSCLFELFDQSDDDDASMKQETADESMELD